LLAVNIAVPLVGLLLGSWLTYWLNFRQRTRTYVADLFARAIESVYAAEASVEYTAGAGRPILLSDEGWGQLQDWFVSESMKNWRNRLDDANVAVARVRLYRPEVADYLPLHLDMQHRDIDPLIEVLRRGPNRRFRRH
jgi:hypothetical protein